MGNKGYKNISNDYYENIEKWTKWWENDVEFHNYTDTYKSKRKMYSLGMAKRESEDWASVLWSDRDKIKTDKKVNSKYIEKAYKDFDLDERIAEAIEISAYSGTCAAVIRIKDAKIKKGRLIADEDTTKELLLIKAEHIIPLKIAHGKIVDIAFSSEIKLNKKATIYLEIHQLNKDGYHIINKYFDKKTGNEVINEDTIGEYITGSADPWFSLLKPPKVNPIKNNMGLGMSVYGDAIDQLKACDLAYHNYVMDIVLGGKKLIYNKKLIKYKTITYKDNGEEKTKDVPIYPDDISKQQFMEIGDDINANDKELIHEYNPDLRVEDNEKSTQFALDIMSFKAGLGTKFYRFDNGTVVTATQYVGDRQDLVENAKKYRDRLDKFITDIMKTTIYMEKVLFGAKVNTDCNIIIENVDGFMVDQETLKEQARLDLAAGVISKVEYRMKVFHEDEETAKEMVAKINQQYEVKEVNGE